MKDVSRDRIEDGASAVVEGLVSMIPLAGGPLAVAVNRAYGSAWQRRHEQILRGLAASLDAHIEAGNIQDPVGALSSPQAIAAIERALRASHEAASDEKVSLLRDALLGALVLGNSEETDELLSIAQRLPVGAMRFLRVLSVRAPERDGFLTVVELTDEVYRSGLDDSLDIAYEAMIREQLARQFKFNPKGSSPRPTELIELTNRGTRFLNMIKAGRVSDDSGD